MGYTRPGKHTKLAIEAMAQSKFRGFTQLYTSDFSDRILLENGELESPTGPPFWRFGSLGKSQGLCI